MNFLVRVMIGSLLISIGLSVHAWHWRDLWLTPDQQGQRLMQAGQFKAAQTHFRRPDWQATAAYRAKAYYVSAKQFGALNSENGFYNQGNALAQSGRYQEAIKAYDQGLKLNPNNQDAQFNRKLIADLLQQSQQNEPSNHQSSPEQKPQDNSNQSNGSNDQNDSMPDPSDQNSKENSDEKPSDDVNPPSDSTPEQKQPSETEKPEHSNTDPSEQANQHDENQPKPNQDGATAAQSTSEKEDQQAKEQWLHLVPDDPAFLLRQKFLRDYRRRQQGG